MKTTLIFIFLLGLPFGWSGQTPLTQVDTGSEALRYDFTYRFQMDMQGKILLVAPYRFYHEASAAVKFIARKNKNQGYEFCYAGISGTGYVMATGGLTGTSLYFFTADYDLERSARFREKKIHRFLQEQPYYSANIKKIRRRPMKILSTSAEAMRFNRDSRGIHTNPVVKMRLTDPHSKTYANIYEMMGALLQAYNHSFLPREKDGLKRLKQSARLAWESRPLDFSKILTQAARLSSEGAEKRAHFKQEEKFTLHYRIISINNDSMEICGESYPGVKVGKDMKIRHTLRKISLRLEDDVVTEDTLFLDFRDDKGKGGTVELELKLTKK